MIPRLLTKHILNAVAKYPAITLTGPRQSGKTTLVRAIFQNHDYASLESPDVLDFARSDPRGFLGQFHRGVVLDEVQRAPDLFSYIQELVDADRLTGRFILTGSQNLQLLSQVSQSLAGRTAIFHLLPFSRAELAADVPLDPNDIGTRLPESVPIPSMLTEQLFRGFYPPIYDRNLDAHEWLRDYYRTYVERDVRSITNVGDLAAFSRFVRLCAGRCGQLLNVSSLGADCGVSHTTAQRWLSILETTFVIYLLRPHFRNFSKRLIKSPKLYFIDTGLLAYLLRIGSPSDLLVHGSRGAIFESYVVSELVKTYWHAGREPALYFWRDTSGHEVDVVIDKGALLTPIEIKSGETIASDFFDGLDFFLEVSGQADRSGALVYGGSESRVQFGHHVYAWNQWL